MKKATKVCLILCSILAIVGLVLFLIGASLGFGIPQIMDMIYEGKFQFGNVAMISREDTVKVESGHNGEHHVTRENWTKKEVEYFADDVQNLDIEFDFGTLILEHTDGEHIEIEAGYRSKWNNYKRSIGWKVKGNTLEIKDTLHEKILKLFHFSNDDATLTLRIPEGKVFDEISVEIGAASFIVETELVAKNMDIVIGAGKMINSQGVSNTLQAEELDLEIGAGSMEFCGIQAKELNLECGAGNMKISDVTVQHTDLDCGVGEIVMELSGREKDYAYEVDCGIGEVVIGESSYSGLGQSKMVNNGGNKFLDIDCGVGAVHISFAE